MSNFSLKRARWLALIAEKTYSKRLGHPLIVMFITIGMALFYINAVSQKVTQLQANVIVQTQVRRVLLTEELEHNLYLSGFYQTSLHTKKVNAPPNVPHLK